MTLSGHGIPSRGPAVFIVTTVTLILATLFVAARLVSRLVILKVHSWDDFLILLGWLLAFGLSFAIDYGANKGLGRHNQDVPTPWMPELRKATYAFTVIYNPALMATKSSILVFYLRMSKNTEKALRTASYIILAIVNLDGIVLTFLNIFQCSPVRAAWTSEVGSCLSIVTLYLASAPVNIFTDLAILVLPLPVLTSMRLPQRQKTVLIFTFTLGAFATIVDIVRIYYLQQASDADISLTKSEVRVEDGNDFFWNAALALMWSAVEVNVGIICACIPTLKPLIVHILPAILTDKVRTFGSRQSSQKSNGPSSAHDVNGQDAPSDPDAGSEKHLQPAAVPNAYHDEGNQIDMMDFLTTPGMDPAITRSPTIRTYTTQATEDAVYFGFVNMKKPRSMLKTRGRESFNYCAMVTILFFLWGFSYGLLNNLNNKIADLARMSTSQRIGLSSAYFSGYFFGPMTIGQYVLRRYGFRFTFITGLCIYGTGTLIFWPSAVLLSFPGFIISNFVVAFGLSLLETAANPFLVLCGVNTHAEFRLLIAQGIQAIATVCSEALAEKALFTKLSTLIDVQWTYLAIALFDVLLALFFYYMPLPEASDRDLQTQTDLLHPVTIDDKLRITVPARRSDRKVMIPIILTTLVLAVFSQYVYVAGQECMSVFFSTLLTEQTMMNSLPVASLVLTPESFFLVARALFAASRFIAGFLCLVIRPRVILLASYVLSLLSTIIVVALPSSVSGNGISAPTLLFFFFEAPIFPLVFALGLRGLGDRTKFASALLTAAVSGGAGWPFVVWAAQQTGNLSVQHSFAVVIALLAAGCSFPLWLNLTTSRVRRAVDPIVEDNVVAELGGEDGRAPSRRRSSLKKRATTLIRFRPDAEGRGWRRSHGSRAAGSMMTHDDGDHAVVEHRECMSTGGTLKQMSEAERV